MKYLIFNYYDYIMATKTLRWLVKYIYKKMRNKWREPVDNKVIGKYLLINGIRWNKEVLEYLVADEESFTDPLDSAEFTKFYIDITKYIKWYQYKKDKNTKEEVKVLLDNKFDQT
jgi:hypothetical protein